MASETNPSTHNLLASWVAIWKARLNGKREYLDSAVRTHVRLFPMVHQHDAEHRVKRLIAMADPREESLREVIARAEATLYSL